MNEFKTLLSFAETLIHQKTSTYCSELQRQILITAFTGERKTYDQLAEECRYSPKYVKQDVAPKLWHLLSEILGEKVTKANARNILSRAIQSAKFSQTLDSTGTAETNLEQGEIIRSVVVQPFIGLEGSDLLTYGQPEHPKILLVDDQAKNLRLLTELLEEQGYQVMQALNGAIALEAMTQRQPDLILLDIHMPEMDGYTVCQKIKANHETEHIPIIFVSAMDEAWDKVRAFSVGGVDYITKPFKVVEVLARVENQLKIQQLQQTLKAQNLQLHQALQELQRLAAIDELTQVASRRRFDAYLVDLWQAAIPSKTPLTLMLCQLDHFTFYGDEGNQKLGDQILYRVAQEIQQTVDGEDTLVCRYGTLTFAVILPNENDSEAIAQRLLNNICALDVGMPQPLSLSIGIKVLVPSSELGIEMVIDDCTFNLQKAQNRGGNSYVE